MLGLENHMALSRCPIIFGPSIHCTNGAVLRLRPKGGGWAIVHVQSTTNMAHELSHSHEWGATEAPR